MLADFRDYLKTLDIAEHYYIGKINNATEKAIGVYSMSNIAPVEAIGLASSYDVAGIRILIHWNKNADETEQTARTLYEALRHITNTDMGSTHVSMVSMDTGEPDFLGTDDNGVYEYHISLLVYYNR